MRTGQVSGPSTSTSATTRYALTNIPTLARNMLNSVVVTLAPWSSPRSARCWAATRWCTLRCRGGRIVLGLLVASLFFPTRVTSLIAIFEIQRGLGLINTTAGLILPYVTLNLALSVFIMRGIFEQISHELVDAARIDGAGAWRTLLSVLLPLTRNGIVVVIIVNFVTRLGRVSAGRHADQRPGGPHPAGCARRRVRRDGPVGLAAHRRGLRYRHRPWPGSLRLYPALVHAGPAGGRAQVLSDVASCVPRTSNNCAW